MSTTNDPRLPERELATDSASRVEAGRGYQIVAMFETFERARAARDRLLEEGIPSSEMDIVNREAEEGYSNFKYERNDQGFWGAIKRFFVPDEHAVGYAEGLRRGNAMLVVRPSFEQHDRVAGILEQYDPIDFDAREEEWRKAGWAGGAPLMTTETGHGALGRSDLDRPATEPVDTTVGMADVNAGARVPGESLARPMTGSAVAGREESIPVVEENVRVGKRMVDRGSVRVRSYVVERPVEEDVTLRDETVSVERRAVDRPVGTLPEDAFRERTIEVSASGEEPVIQKDARVVEEVVVNKDVQDRTETVRGTERKTEVEVEDSRTGQKVQPSKR